MKAIGPKLVIATHNAGKLREIRELLAPHGIECVGAAELDLPEPEETGTTFVANADLKAQQRLRLPLGTCQRIDGVACLGAHSRVVVIAVQDGEAGFAHLVGSVAADFLSAPPSTLQSCASNSRPGIPAQRTGRRCGSRQLCSFPGRSRPDPA